MTDQGCYPRTDRTQDVGFVFGALCATHLPGPMLIEILRHLHLTESAARNTLAKMVRQGALVTQPLRRVRRYSLSPSVLMRFVDVKSAGSVPAWSGEFRAVVHSVPGTERRFRDRLQYLAVHHGFGTLRAGVLISVHDRTAELLERLGEVPATVTLHRAGLVPDDLGQARRMAARAWDLEQLAATYRTVRHEVDARLEGPLEVPAHDEGRWDLFRAWNRLYRSVTRVRIQDPHLTPELLPTAWPATDLGERLERINAVWGLGMAPFLRA